MKLNQIRDVLAVADMGSLRAAARRLGVAQPTISRSIREIEHELGTSLFERHSRGVRLTVIGEAFLRRGRSVESELRRAREEVEQLKGQSTGGVTVAMSIASSIALLPSTLAAFHRRYPDAVLTVSETLFPAVKQEVADGRIDVYVGALDLSLTPPMLIVDKLFENQRIVVGRRGHPLLHTATPDDLARARWVRPALSARASEAEFEDWFASVGLPRPKVVMHTRSALLTIMAVTSTDLLTVMPRQWLEFPALADQLGALSFVEPMEAAPVCLVRQAGAPLTPMAEYFCDQIHRVATNYGKRSAN